MILSVIRFEIFFKKSKYSSHLSNKKKFILFYQLIIEILNFKNYQQK